MNTRAIALIPAFEPDARMTDLVKELSGRGFDILIVDDGSGSGFEPIFEEAARYGTVLHHEKNRGKGAALKTGLRWIETEIDTHCVVVTVDADGQHLPDDVERTAAVAEAAPNALVLGSRCFQGEVPLRSKLGNTLTRTIFRLTTGVQVQDTQTGLRAFSSTLLPCLTDISGDRYEYEMNVLMHFAQNGLPIREVTIQTVYLDGNRSSHFHVLRDSCLIYGELLKFSASSLASFLLDYGLFCLFSMLTGAAVLSNILARLLSAAFNYTVNRRLVFDSSARTRTALPQYAALALGILTLNTLFLWFLTSVTGLPAYIAKLLVESVLFFVSYTVQKRWIFKEKTTRQQVPMAI